MTNHFTNKHNMNIHISKAMLVILSMFTSRFRSVECEPVIASFGGLRPTLRIGWLHLHRSVHLYSYLETLKV